MNILHAVLLGIMLVVSQVSTAEQAVFDNSDNAAATEPANDIINKEIAPSSVSPATEVSAATSVAAPALASTTLPTALSPPITSTTTATPTTTTTPTIASTTTPPTTGSAVVTTNPVSVVLGLFFIVLLIFAIAWILRRVGAVPLMGTSSMRVVAGLSVGTREKVVLIEVGNKQLLLGVAPGRVSHLYSFDEPVVNAMQTHPSEFALKIKQFMQPGTGK